MTVEQKACLICIDGWGINQDTWAEPGDAIHHAKTPVMDHLKATYPYTEIAAHGLSVGLPDGLMGNSEVGHLNIGAGRIVYQDIVRIELAVKNKTLGQTDAVKGALDHCLKGNKRLHLMGLVSDGGVHSHIQHLMAFLQVAKDAGVDDCFVHFFGDGRDTSPRSTVTYLKQLQEYMAEIQYGSIATMTGRYYAMDRDKRWERIQLAYNAMVLGQGEASDNLMETVEKRYAQDETDEFLKPIIGDKRGIIQDEDTVICFNFRSDRMREICQALGIEPKPFECSKILKNVHIVTMTQYKADFPFPVIFPPQTMDNVLAEWLDKQHVPQCHVAETEKYAHVTFFFNGGTEAHYTLEHRDLIDSPKVATYDLLPEMSAIAVAEKVAERIRQDQHPFVMCNFAPPDMVGHTGVYEAAVKGVEATDKGIGIIYEACKEMNYTLLVTADHGNAERMIAQDGTPYTAHTCNKVPFVMTSTSKTFVRDTETAALCDVAPTVLDLMGIPLPSEMTGRSLIQH